MVADTAAAAETRTGIAGEKRMGETVGFCGGQCGGGGETRRRGGDSREKRMGPGQEASGSSKDGDVVAVNAKSDG